MNLYKLNRVLHRDLGYFFIGMTIIYALSGIALNHRSDWNPNYSVNHREFSLGRPLEQSNTGMPQIREILGRIGEISSYKSHYFPRPDRLTIFIEGGNVSVDLPTGDCEEQSIRRRPVFYQVNFLHYNPGRLWTWFSDIFCVLLIFLAVSGLFIIKGSKGLKWRGTVIGTLGILLPLAILYYYLM